MFSEKFLPKEFKPISDQECKDFIAALKWLEEIDNEEDLVGNLIV
jgi:hypothetical protein